MAASRWARGAGLAAGLAAALVAGRAVGGEVPPAVQQLLEALREGEPAFTAAELEATVREVASFVERATGRKLRQPPTVKLSDRAELAAVLAHDMLAVFRSLAPNQSEADLQRTASQESVGLALCLLGLYSAQGKTLYMLPRNFSPLLRLVKVDPRHTPAVLKMCVAHELTHALQDQEVNLGLKYRQVRSVEELNALKATVEGHAVFVQEIVGKELGLGDAVAEYARAFSAGGLKVDDPALNAIMQQANAQNEFIYLGGRRFIAHQFEQGGMPRLWQILANPPTATSMIAQPATYSPIRPAPLDCAQVLEGLEQDFGPRPWQVRNLAASQMMLAAAYKDMDPAQRAEILANVVSGQTLVAQCAQPPAAADVSLILLKDPAFAPKYVGALEALTQRQVAAAQAAGTPIQGFEVQRHPQPPPGYSVASKIVFALGSPGGPPMRHVFVRVGFGDALVEVHELNVGLSDEQLAAIAQKVLVRYQAARAPRPAPQP